MNFFGSKKLTVAGIVTAVLIVATISLILIFGNSDEKDSAGAQSDGTVNAVQKEVSPKEAQIYVGGNELQKSMLDNMLAEKRNTVKNEMQTAPENIRETDSTVLGSSSTDNKSGDGSGTVGEKDTNGQATSGDDTDVLQTGENTGDGNTDGTGADGEQGNTAVGDGTDKDIMTAEGGENRGDANQTGESLAGKVVGTEEHIIVDDILMEEEYSNNRKKYLEILGRLEEGIPQEQEEKVKFLSVYTQGTDDDSVAAIQERLMELGFMEYAEPTKHYGPATMEAVKFFQRQNDLKQDGIIGEQTIGLLFTAEAKSYLLKKDMDGEDIRTIQYRLYELGYIASKDQVTGHFGDETEKAVKALQTANGLSADGKIGVMTNELLYSGDVKANLISFGDKSDIVLECQKRLQELGYLTTAPDGFYGSDTQAAVKQFQSKNDCIVDGYLGPSTRAVLISDAAVPNGLRIGDQSETVKRVQELLIKHGYLAAGNATGYFGDVTEAAVKKFQKNNGLTADGNVGKLTMAVLTGDSVVKNSNDGVGGTGKDTGKDTDKNKDTGKDKDKDKKDSETGGEVVVTGTNADELIKVAKSKLGCPYIYGNKGPNSFDCSGYVYWCLKQIGVNQSYITSYQWRTVGKYKKITSISDVKKGDIIVVYGHVGIAAGNNMVYDASSSAGEIVYRELGDWWKRNFICAWRIF